MKLFHGCFCYQVQSRFIKFKHKNQCVMHHVCMAAPSLLLFRDGEVVSDL